VRDGGYDTGFGEFGCSFLGFILVVLIQDFKSPR
jgi:hypothetical protein